MDSDFDNLAMNYDAVFTRSAIGKAQRNRVYHFLSEEIRNTKSLHILEVNCGTGEDALFFAKNGHKVIATDISENMINEAKKKNASASVRFLQQDINTLTSASFSDKFDLIFSNFGGLNCLSLSQIRGFLTISEKLLKPKGKLMLVVMPKNCLWERFYFSVKGSFKEARRRNSNDPILVNVNGTEVSTWYYNPKDLMSLSKEKYNTLFIKPIGIAIPPSYLESYFERNKIFLNLLVLIEGLFSSRLWARYGDHYLIAFQKR
jgi:ubiquinone/menaquinone biosynthesis C-methylase UbiE